jgi:hypothetical protein
MWQGGRAYPADDVAASISHESPHTGAEPVASQIHPCARALHELNPHDNPYPTHWKPVAPLYTRPMREISDARIYGAVERMLTHFFGGSLPNVPLDGLRDKLHEEIRSILAAARSEA